MKDLAWLGPDEGYAIAEAESKAQVLGMLTPFFDSPLRRRAESLRNLTAYVARMMGRYYPAHSWG